MADTQENWFKMMDTLMKSMHSMMETNSVKGTTTSTVVKVPPPECYNGERDTSKIEGWLRSLEQYFEFTRLEPDRQVGYAVILLHGRAASWWRQQETNTKAHELQWPVFRIMILNEFQPINARRKARDRLAACHQTGTVQHFVETFHDIQLDLPGLDGDELLDRFTRGLKPAVRVHVLKEAPETLDAAERLALAFESAHQIEFEVHQPTRVVPNYNEPQPMDLDYVDHRQRRYGNKPKQFGRNRSGRSSRCFACNKEGHRVKDCLWLKDLKDKARTN